MRSQPRPLQRTLALLRSGGNATAKYLPATGAGCSGEVRTATRRNHWEGDLFVDKVGDRRADGSMFNVGKCDASHRTPLFIYRPRLIGSSVQGPF